MSTIPKVLVLITGANSGIGFELAAQLLSKTNPTYHVFLASRSLSKGTAALKDLEARKLPGTAEVLRIEMTDDATITAAATSVAQNHGRLDILVNNAAIALPPAEGLREQMRLAFDTNATGPLMLTEAFAPLLKKSTNPARRIVNVSSGVGSIGRRLNRESPMYKLQGQPYRASKTALNMITACAFAEYEEFGIKVFAYDPGFTVSNLSENNKAEKGARSVEESVRPLVDVLEGRRDEECGGELKFLHNTGVYSW